MNRKGLIISLAGLVIFMAIAGAAYNKLSKNYTQNTEKLQTETTQELKPAPDFTATDTAGNKVSLSDFKGTPVVINFWATWCPPCKQELPYFQNLFEEYGDRVKFMMVNLTDGVDETIKTVENFINETGYTFPVYYDTEYSGAIAYGTYSIPVTVFIDKQGNLVHSQVGAMTETALYLYITKLLQ